MPLAWLLGKQPLSLDWEGEGLIDHVLLVNMLLEYRLMDLLSAKLLMGQKEQHFINVLTFQMILVVPQRALVQAKLQPTGSVLITRMPTLVLIVQQANLVVLLYN